MRPTNLNYRNPKEKSGEYVYPIVTSNGSGLIFPKQNSRSRSTFSRGKRWDHIEDISRRTGFTIGPGCYDFRMSTNKGLGAKIMLESALTSTRDYDKDIEYVCVNNLIIKQEKPRPRSQSQLRLKSAVSLGNYESQQDNRASCGSIRSIKMSRSGSNVDLRAVPMKPNYFNTERRENPMHIMRTEPVEGDISERRVNTSWRANNDSLYLLGPKPVPKGHKVRPIAPGQQLGKSDLSSGTLSRSRSLIRSATMQSQTEMLKLRLTPQKIVL